MSCVERDRSVDIADQIAKGRHREAGYGFAMRSGADEAAYADKPPSIGRLSQPDDLDSAPGVRRMHHASAADVDADMSEPRKEEQVARLHLGTCYGPAQVMERVRAVWKFDPQPPVSPVDEP
jgi:hypothetical protein